ncbi:MAG: DNA polymerase I [Alphaproteobacteria bacterium]|nr:DNA polymerase I [Alphaproteobacteria bacterium]
MTQTLCLIDGSGYIYRAFYAVPSHMTRPRDKLPINAVYGFTSMMIQFLQKHSPDYLAVVFDAKRANFRNTIYPEYKATRREVPEALVPQFPLIREAVKAFQIPGIEQEGFEADDLIASYARQAKDSMQVIVVSADKDLMQLMSPSVSIYDPMKGKMLTEEDVKNKFGVTPDQVVQVQALAGDSSDNVPGVAGVGPKTAASLIQKYGSVDGVYQHIDEVAGAVGQKLRQDKDKALMSLQLVKLADEASLPLPVADLKRQAIVRENIESFCRDNGFFSLLPRLDKICNAPQVAPVRPALQYTVIQAADPLKKWLSEVTSPMAWVTQESEGALVGVALATAQGRACYIPLRQAAAQADLFGQTFSVVPKDLKQALAGLWGQKNICKIGHGIKSVWSALRAFFGTEGAGWEDTQLLAYTACGARQDLTLPALSQLFLKTSLPQADSAERALAEQAYTIACLFEALQKYVQAPSYRQFDLPLMPVLASMEQQGLLLDPARLKALSEKLDAQMKELSENIYALAGGTFNINSPAQLGEILFDKMGLKCQKGKNTARSTDIEILEDLAQQGVLIASHVIEYRRCAKLKSTYADALLAQMDPQTCRIHTTFSQIATSTGRLSSSDPNLQNIPVRTPVGKDIRSAFIAPKGHVLLSADYSQIELRLMAHVADVTALRQAFEQGADIHTSTAQAVFKADKVTPELRRRAKAINFGIMYGLSPFGLARQLGISNSDAKAYIDSYFEHYPQIREYMRKTAEQAEHDGYVTTLFGRRCFVNFGATAMAKAAAVRAAINAPIQGGAADLIKKAMIEIADELAAQKRRTRMLLQVHDELIFEVPEKELDIVKPMIKEKMEHAVELSVPLVVETGAADNWMAAHE